MVTGGSWVVLVMNCGTGMVTVLIAVLVKTLVSIIVDVLVSLSVLVTGGMFTKEVEYEITGGRGGWVTVLVLVIVL